MTGMVVSGEGGRVRPCHQDFFVWRLPLAKLRVLRLTFAVHVSCRAPAAVALVSVPPEYEYCRIDGNTPHDTRQDLIEEYNAPVCPCSLHFY